MKFLIVGLGNIGSEYENTRHNIGFKILDAYAKASSIFFSTNRLGDVAEVKVKGKTLILLKPSTYMNLSGKALNYWMQQEKISIENVLIITDDLALPFGTIRLKGKGSDGGHNGLKSIQETLQATNYARLRFGIGAEFGTGHQVNYVLGQWNEEEQKTLDERIEMGCKVITSFCTAGLNITMSAFNGK